MELTVIGKYRALVIRPDDELDQHSAENIRTEADRLLKKTGLCNVVFDMRNVRFMDSSGIGVIMGRYRTVCTMGGVVAICGMNSLIDRVVQMSGLRDIVIITDRLQNALEEVLSVCLKTV